eukprot:2848128-Alexandrium_andersonii.AAC.1
MLPPLGPCSCRCGNMAADAGATRGVQWAASVCAVGRGGRRPRGAGRSPMVHECGYASSA